MIYTYSGAKLGKIYEKWKKRHNHFFHFTKILFLMRYLNYKVLYLND